MKEPKLTDASKANKSGQELEKKLKQFLIENDFAYVQQRPRSPEIDFIIGNGKENKKYGYSDVYIIRGEHIPNNLVIEHCNEICRTKGFKMHIVTFEEFCAILLKKEYLSPLEYFFKNNEETHVNT